MAGLATSLQAPVGIGSIGASLYYFDTLQGTHTMVAYDGAAGVAALDGKLYAVATNSSRETVVLAVDTK